MSIFKKAFEKTAELIPGGKASKYSRSDFDEKYLKAARKVEKEHSPVKEKQEEIGMDHALEKPKLTPEGKITSDYYKELIKMEKRL
jgi:hypothetical protein